MFGPLQHYRWFQLHEFSRKKEARWIRSHRLGYWGFGAVHLTLQLVPGLSILFLFTSAAGAALWAVEIERREGLLRQDGGNPELGEEEGRRHLCRTVS